MCQGVQAKNSIDNPGHGTPRKVPIHKGGFVVIDDDPIFLKLITAAAEQASIPCDSFSSIDDLVFLSKIGNYDLAIIDLHLPTLNGLEILQYIDSFFQSLPALLVSADEEALSKARRESRRKEREFVSKLRGPHGILATAIEVLEQSKKARSA